MVFEATPLALITVPMLGFVGAMLYRRRSDLSHSLKRVWVGCALQFVLLLATIGVATHGEVDWTRQPFLGPNDSALHIEEYIAVAALVVAAFTVARAKGNRWLATSLMVLQLWLLVSANEVAGMALTGRWL